MGGAFVDEVGPADEVTDDARRWARHAVITRARTETEERAILAMLGLEGEIA